MKEDKFTVVKTTCMIQNLKKVIAVSIIQTLIVLAYVLLILRSYRGSLELFYDIVFGVLIVLNLISIGLEIRKHHKKVVEFNDSRLTKPYLLLEERHLRLFDSNGRDEHIESRDIEEITYNKKKNRVFIRTSSIRTNHTLYDEYDIPIEEIYRKLIEKLY